MELFALLLKVLQLGGMEPESISDLVPTPGFLQSWPAQMWVLCPGCVWVLRDAAILAKAAAEDADGHAQRDSAADGIKPPPRSHTHAPCGRVFHTFGADHAGLSLARHVPASAQ